MLTSGYLELAYVKGTALPAAARKLREALFERLREGRGFGTIKVYLTVSPILAPSHNVRKTPLSDLAN
jgi:hypothetical protein